MRNAVAMLVYNQVPEQLALSKKAVLSVIEQDIPVDLFIVDNGSTDGTWEWLESIACEHICIERRVVNESPIKLGNEQMEELFGRLGYQHILGVPNDIVLPSNFYREVLRWPRGIVTGSMTSEKNFTRFEESHAVHTHTPMAVALVRKWCYDALMAKDGFFFDPRFTFYYSDNDMALRIAACGIAGIQLDLQYWHYGSASHRLLPQDLAEVITGEGDTDKFRFLHKWGFLPADPEYGQCCGDINFRG